MVDRWRANPRWTTAHEIYKDTIYGPDSLASIEEMTARDLAWQVFFNIHIMDYERKKREENGDI
jgi:hypothetical protein